MTVCKIHKQAMSPCSLELGYGSQVKSLPYQAFNNSLCETFGATALDREPSMTGDCVSGLHHKVQELRLQLKMGKAEGRGGGGGGGWVQRLNDTATLS